MGEHWHKTRKTKTKRAICFDKGYEPILSVTLHYDAAIPDELPTSSGYKFEVFRVTPKGNLRSIPWYSHDMRIDGGMIKLPIAPAMRLLAA